MEARLDKWLWATRIYKTRTLAADACKNGRVSINGAQAKPSRTVKAGDEVAVKKSPITYTFRVKQAIEKRVGAKLLPDVLENITKPEQYELLEMSRISGFVGRARGTGRPTKKTAAHSTNLPRTRLSLWTMILILTKTDTLHTYANSKWAPVVVLVDADYLDRVAADLTLNFGRMIGRSIAKADLCHWLDCVLLDGALRPGHNEVQVHMLHAKQKAALEHFQPSRFDEDLNGLSFDDNLGHFSLFAFPVEDVVRSDEFFLQSLTMLADAAEVKKLLVVGDTQSYGKGMVDICQNTDDKDITLFAMEPVMGQGFKTEILGYSLMSAMGISADELR